MEHKEKHYGLRARATIASLANKGPVEVIVGIEDIIVSHPCSLTCIFIHERWCKRG